MRIVSLVLALAFCLLMPMTALAAEVTEPLYPTEITEVVEIIDYTPLLTDISLDAAMSADFLQIITGCLVFFVVVTLCYFVYKFFRIFF